MADPRSDTAPRGVIHDIGYRSYQGPREGDGRIALALYVTALRHAFGLGRSGRSKVLPVILVVLAMLPAVVMVGVLAFVGADEPLLSPLGYTNAVQVLVSIFAAAQAPVIFSRDLRSRSIALYLARPLGAATFALARLAALVTAILLFVLVPQLLLFAGGLLAGLDVGEETLALLEALPVDLLIATLLGSITGLVASIALRRGFAVVSSVLVLVVLHTVVTSIQFVTAETSASDTIGQLAGLLSPWAIVNGVTDVLDAGVESATPPEGAAMVALYVAVALLVVAACAAGLVQRFRKAGR
ncbi:ABC transporter permease [Nocardioides sp. Y6]|uniref:ABC transporter permease n=1 Tax=Nocardioides malaquae TaxID=2773426 RepID=A0ABR9RTI0_9ACTN|nr:ABC transporter permease [Nocardioides malaquae]MBE7324889.1 ABC transporter permease [Nocardioides malaquae]